MAQRPGGLPGEGPCAPGTPQGIHIQPQNQTHAARRLRVSNRRVDLLSNMERVAIDTPGILGNDGNLGKALSMPIQPNYGISSDSREFPRSNAQVEPDVAPLCEIRPVVEH